MSDGLVLARGLCVSRRGRRVLDDASLVVPPGLISLVGPNGAGKTTFLECVAGQLRPDSGVAFGWSHDAGMVGYVPQEPVLPGSVSVVSAVQYAVWLRGVSWVQAGAAAETALARVNLEQRVRDRVGTLSGGMRRRLAIAVVLALQPRVLLLDESLVGLDPVQRAEVLAVLREVAETVPVVTATHVLSDILEFGGRVVAMSHGRLSAPVDVAGLGGGTTFPSLSQLQDWYMAEVA